MPFKIKKTISSSVVTGNSVLFNGTNQYLSVPGNAAFNFGTGNFTIEWWQYMTSQPSNPRVFSIGNYPSTTIGVSIEGSGTFYLWENSSVRFSYSLTADGYLNRWLHFAISRNNGNTSIFKNGIQIGSSYSDTNNINNTSTALSIGQESSATAASYFPGYISNLRILNGTALYTSNFTPSTTPLSAIANTSLLACQSATIIDNSSNNFAITNNNTATVSSTVVPFTTSLSLFKLKKNNANPTAPSGNSVLFNGSNQYLSLPNTSSLNLGSNNFTMEAFVYIPNVSGNKNIFYINGNAGSYSAICLYVQDSQFAFLAGTTGGYPWTLQIGAVGPTISSNTWYHVATTRSGNSFYVFVNGTLVSGAPYSLSGALFNGTTNIIGYQPTVTSYFNGYISNARIINGTALYTASFTAPTAPLTAIANTSLLTCNSATIIDSSSNNFTITNNNTATVSSTITPFTASISTNKFKLKQVSYVRTLPGTQKAIFGYGNTDGAVSVTNLVSNTGVVATDTAGVGSTRGYLSAAGYGSDKAIFGYGWNNGGAYYSMTNLVSNNGVVANNTTGVGTARIGLAAAGYGSDKALFGYGYSGAYVSMTNLVSNTGVVATDTTGVGTARSYLAAAGYGSDKAIFGYGYTAASVSMTNLVSNTGVVATDTTGVGTARNALAATSYGTDKAIFGYGSPGNVTNLVSNTGVVATDTSGVGTARFGPAAAGYGSDKAIFGYGNTGAHVSMTNKVSNAGVVSTDTAGVGTVRYALAAAGYSAT
jgi:hypothetical protein